MGRALNARDGRFRVQAQKAAFGLQRQAALRSGFFGLSSLASAAFLAAAFDHGFNERQVLLGLADGFTWTNVRSIKPLLQQGAHGVWWLGALAEYALRNRFGVSIPVLLGAGLLRSQLSSGTGHFRRKVCWVDDQAKSCLTSFLPTASGGA